MVSLPYAEVDGRAKRPTAARVRWTVNWRLIAALAFNVLAWVGLVKLIAYFL